MDTPNSFSFSINTDPAHAHLYESLQRRREVMVLIECAQKDGRMVLFAFGIHAASIRQDENGKIIHEITLKPLNNGITMQ